jgi:integrase
VRADRTRVAAGAVTRRRPRHHQEHAEAEELGPAEPNHSAPETDERLVELWLARKAPSTQRKYAEDLGKFRDFTEGKPLTAVTLADLHDFASFISVLMAPSSQGRVLATLKSLLSFANRVGYLPFNVGAAVVLPKVKDTLSERILTEAEAHRIMNAPKNTRDRALVSVHGSPRWCTLPELMSCLRRGERHGCQGRGGERVYRHPLRCTRTPAERRSRRSPPTRHRRICNPSATVRGQ